MNERPVWTRAALYNQFSPAELREIHKYVLHHMITEV
jgi:hypothetical protein